VANALHDLGFQITVYEQSAVLTEIGAGIGVPANACKVMRHLGLLKELEEVGVADTYGSYRDARTGEEVRRTDHTQARERYGAPFLRLHRWDMQQVLANGLARRAPGAVKLGRRLEHVEPASEQVRLIFADGTHETADLVIASDGIRSTVRTELFGADEPSFTGFANWRGLVPVGRVEPNMRIDTTSFRRGLLVRNYLVRGGELMNIVASVRSDTWVGEDWRIPGGKQDFLNAFAEFYPDMRRLLAAIPAEDLFKWGLFLRPRLHSWVTGRVALLGDAARAVQRSRLGEGESEMQHADANRRRVAA
jgi:salicylate hydroxylase